MTGFVYCIVAEGVPLAKIGYSRDLGLRIEVMEASCPLPLRVVGAVAGTRFIERGLHLHFCERRAHREWFRDADEEIQSLFSREDAQDAVAALGSNAMPEILLSIRMLAAMRDIRVSQFLRNELGVSQTAYNSWRRGGSCSHETAIKLLEIARSDSERRAA